MPSSTLLCAPLLIALTVMVVDSAAQQPEASATHTLLESEAPSVTVTNDSPQFCTTLLNAIDSHSGTLPEEVRTLREEGVDLCDRGHERQGVMRLRRALVALKEGDEPRR